LKLIVKTNGGHATGVTVPYTRAGRSEGKATGVTVPYTRVERSDREGNQSYRALDESE